MATALFDDVPVFTPPFPPRPPRRLSGPHAIARFARDQLRPFDIGAFSRPMTHRRVLGRDLHVLNAPGLVREAFVGAHDALQRKTPQMRTALCPLAGDGLIVSDGKVWSDRRGAIARIVHGRNMASFFPSMLDVALDWRARWRTHVDAPPIDILHEMGLLTAEIIARAVFGHRPDHRLTERIISGFVSYQAHVSQIAIPDMLGLPAWVPRGQSRKARRAADAIREAIDGIVEEIEAERRAGAAGPAMISALFDGTAGLSREAIRNEAIVLFMAGHETTANTLAWALYLLSQAPWAREGIDAEIESVLGDRDPTLEDVGRLVYTRAVVEEALRLYPPVPMLGREAICPASVGGIEIEAGSIVLVAPWLLHRNPDLWERPDDFIPERFLPSVPRPSKYQYVPFAIGPRVCPGMAFGLTEATLCLAVLRQAYDLRLAPGQKVVPQTRLTLRPGPRLDMSVEARPAS